MMDEQNKPLKGDDISERFLTFAARVLRLCDALPQKTSTRHIIGQLGRSGTSAGANYEEARGAESQSDFVHKLGVCLKEIRESYYWLRIIEKAGLVPSEKMTEIIKEADELCRIIATSVKSARSKKEGVVEKPES